jgi:hypothetical protein
MCENVDFSEAAGMGRLATDVKDSQCPAVVAKKRVFYALMACISGTTPKICIARFRL